MSGQGKPLFVGWKVSSLAPSVASVRYRAAMPMIALESAGVSNRLFAVGLDGCLQGLDALVIVKSFTADDLRLAQMAAAQGTRVIFDLCDNVFIAGYVRKKNAPAPADMLASMAKYLSCIVVTTEPLATEVRARVPGVPVVVIPDGIETQALGAEIGRVLREAAAAEKKQRLRLLMRRVANVLRRVREEGPASIPPLVRFVARRLGLSMSGKARSLSHRTKDSGAAAAATDARQGTESQPGADRIVWFGNHGAEHAQFGMLDILLYREALETIAAERNVELVVISNNRAKYEDAIRPLAIASRYEEWSGKRVDDALKHAAAAIIPNSLDPFSFCKSANRTVLALAHGVPVIATPTPALQALAPFIHTGDPLEALRRVLRDAGAERQRAIEGYRYAEELYGQRAVQAQWLTLFGSATGPAMASSPSEPYLAIVLDQKQDLDLALPILLEARAADLSCEAWCSAPLVQQSPRVLAALGGARLPFRVLPQDANELANYAFPAGTRALLTVAETNLRPHRVPRILTEAAIRKGLLAVTLQHGYENVGLSYDDSVHSLDKVDIAAQRIYTWGPLHTLHPRATPAVRVRCMPVGCPKEARVPAADLNGLLPADRPVVGIFENLHWHRYSEAYREAFIANVAALTQAFPQVFFVLKPHHAGLWLTRRYEGQKPAGDNLVIADPQAAQWEHHTASALLGHMTAVLTTPSTVALDAARMDIPVAVAAGDLVLDNYEPLTLLADEADWIAFVAAALDAQQRAALQERAARFVGQVLTPGNAARRIVEDVRLTAGN